MLILYDTVMKTTNSPVDKWLDAYNECYVSKNLFRKLQVYVLSQKDKKDCPDSIIR